MIYCLFQRPKSNVLARLGAAKPGVSEPVSSCPPNSFQAAVKNGRTALAAAKNVSFSPATKAPAAVATVSRNVSRFF